MKKNIYNRPEIEIIVSEAEPFLAASPGPEDGHVGTASGEGSNSSTGESWINLAKDHDFDSWDGDDLSRSSGSLWQD